jgi:predicted RNA-binding Zn-ribbon protein involved in translation (DUF1610 family)
VGHTTNFVQRKHAHKNGCINEKSSNYNCKLYKTIRLNGGWDNWVMEIISFFKCNDHYEARIKEQEYFTLLNATLNSIEPMPKPKIKQIQSQKVIEPNKIYYCETSNINFPTETLMENYNQTEKHLKNDDNTKTQNCTNYKCTQCHYYTSRKSQYERHLATDKHKNQQMSTNVNKKVQKDTHMDFECSNCGKEYKQRQGLWRHKQKCRSKLEDSSEDEISEKKTNEPTNRDLIMMLIKENSELKTMMMKVLENGTTNNSHNKQHNI